ncbi:hypothetical protein [Sphingomonas desiccabilis]|uniref:Uncharacterized protein n=1 Tax=Sphingomonas desiccabilis TaxID=429134 RepID=A0A4Q2IPN6_9SPHN|nr:hypothetical protein [Sphingomonas desiccabilis]MBB3911602.1 hypothetical protein [Sphingomonas desiccabilis]RXZ31656.1 hypothetical protein EO081_10530 [Sphingomonas desiccabilis]
MLALLTMVLAAAACGVAPQPVSSETVAAFEVPLPQAKDRAAFLAILRDAARAEGAHVDAATDEDLRDTGAAMPQAKMSIHAAVWRGSDDKEAWATIMDQADHLGQVWIMFSRGENEELAHRFQRRAMRAIQARWPATLSLPIIDYQTIPLRSDLVRTPHGYRVHPSAASRYSDKPTM